MASMRIANRSAYRSLITPYSCLTGRHDVFQPMFMRVLTGLTGPDPQESPPAGPSFRIQDRGKWQHLGLNRGFDLRAENGIIAGFSYDECRPGLCCPLLFS